VTAARKGKASISETAVRFTVRPFAFRAQGRETLSGLLPYAR